MISTSPPASALFGRWTGHRSLQIRRRLSAERVEPGGHRRPAGGARGRLQHGDRGRPRRSRVRLSTCPASMARSPCRCRTPPPGSGCSGVRQSAAGPPIVAGGLVWTIGSDGVLYGLNPTSGTVTEQATIGAPANHFPTPSVGAGLLLAPSSESRRCLLGADGRPTRQHDNDDLATRDDNVVGTNEATRRNQPLDHRGCRPRRHRCPRRDDLAVPAAQDARTALPESDLPGSARRPDAKDVTLVRAATNCCPRTAFGARCRGQRAESRTSRTVPRPATTREMDTMTAITCTSGRCIRSHSPTSAN